MSRRPRRVNYGYLERLLDALTTLGVDVEQLPREFIFMAWEDRAKHIQQVYNLAFCFRCKLPQPDSSMDAKYAVCDSCARALHKTVAPMDPRILDIMRGVKLRAVGRPDGKHLAISNPETPTLADQLQDLFSRRPAGPTDGPSGPPTKPK